MSLLQTSIQNGKYWPNVIARDVGGRLEIPYGHHRIAALKREKGESFQISVVIQELSDDEMAKALILENSTDWSTSFVTDLLNVKGIIGAFGEGRIRLPIVPSKTKKSERRRAPGFTPGSSPDSVDDREYTANSLAQYLGWGTSGSADSSEGGITRPTDRLRAILHALELMEAGEMTLDQIDGISDANAMSLVGPTYSTYRENRRSEKKPSSGSGDETPQGQPTEATGAAPGDAPPPANETGHQQEANAQEVPSSPAPTEKPSTPTKSSPAASAAQAGSQKAKQKGATAKETRQAAQEAASKGGAAPNVEKVIRKLCKVLDTAFADGAQAAELIEELAPHKHLLSADDRDLLFLVLTRQLKRLVAWRLMFFTEDECKARGKAA